MEPWLKLKAREAVIAQTIRLSRLPVFRMGQQNMEIMRGGDRCRLLEQLQRQCAHAPPK